MEYPRDKYIRTILFFTFPPYQDMLFIVYHE